jgi:hypothetical protein
MKPKTKIRRKEMNNVKVINILKGAAVTIISGVSGLALTNLIEKEMTEWKLFAPKEDLEDLEELEIVIEETIDEVEELN